jgi:hypothetical protein
LALRQTALKRERGKGSKHLLVSNMLCSQLLFLLLLYTTLLCAAQSGWYKYNPDRQTRTHASSYHAVYPDEATRPAAGLCTLSRHKLADIYGTLSKGDSPRTLAWKLRGCGHRRIDVSKDVFMTVLYTMLALKLEKSLKYILPRLQFRSSATQDELMKIAFDFRDVGIFSHLAAQWRHLKLNAHNQKDPPSATPYFMGVWEKHRLPNPYWGARDLNLVADENSFRLLQMLPPYSMFRLGDFVLVEKGVDFLVHCAKQGHLGLDPRGVTESYLEALQENRELTVEERTQMCRKLEA